MSDPAVALIVAAADNDVIGKGNALPWHLSADLKYFKAQTLGKPVLMGRLTWESIGRPLPGRPNIVVTRRADYAVTGATVVNSLEAAIAAAQQHATDEIMVIGGAEIYRQALPLADRVYLTRVHVDVEDGDASFLLPAADWVLTWQQFHAAEEGQPACTFRVYRRR
ncbi:MAG: dihydrofolate reductase [Pseudomonadota bacterium]